MSTRGTVCLLIAFFARVLLLGQNSQEWLGKRIEISTPINQWMRGAIKILRVYLPGPKAIFTGHRLTYGCLATRANSARGSVSFVLDFLGCT